MSVIVLQIRGERELFGAFTNLTRAVEDQRDSITEMGAEGLSRTRRRFDQAGPGWSPLAQSTEAKKARRIGGPTRILVDSGRLLGSFSKGSTDNVSRVEALTGEFGSAVPYGVFHQKGGGRLPKREIIKLESDTEEQFAKIIIQKNTRKFRELGFEVS